MSDESCTKTPVSALIEYCTKKKRAPPDFLVREAPHGAKHFICTVTAMDKIAEGIGRSKRDAKHHAAANMLDKIKEANPDNPAIPNVVCKENIPAWNAVGQLNELCIKKYLDPPTFDVIRRSGPANAPMYTIECCVATIKRRGIALTKMAAKQLAAQEILKVMELALAVPDPKEVATVEEISKLVGMMRLHEK